MLDFESRTQRLKLYWVGGGVRDALSKLLNEYSECGGCRKPKCDKCSKKECDGCRILSLLTQSFRESREADVCGAVSGEEVAAALGSGWEAVVSNELLKTYVFKKEDARIEYTPFREEEYAEGGAHRPIAVRFVGTPQEDAQRRDFTCNAIYFDIHAHTVEDPVRGVDAAQRGVLCAVSRDTFAHDGLRLLRLVRFFATKSFEIDPLTMRSARRESAKVRDISPARVRDELQKAFSTGCKRTNRKTAELLDALNLTHELGGRPYSRELMETAEQYPLLVYMAGSSLNGERLDALMEHIELNKKERRMLTLLGTLHEESDAVNVADAVELAEVQELMRKEIRDNFFYHYNRLKLHRVAFSVHDLEYNAEDMTADFPWIKGESLKIALRRLRNEAILYYVPNEKEELRRIWKDICR